MSDDIHTGGCLCGALRYEARGTPVYAGYCCCDDCRKASGSGFIPFMGFPAERIAFTGDTKQSIARSARGGDATRNHCKHCHSLVFGGELGRSETYTLYAGSLDDPSVFEPKMAVFHGCRPDWVRLPEGLKTFDGLPG